jgi:hypothetical protein
MKSMKSMKSIKSMKGMKRLREGSAQGGQNTKVHR